MSGIVFRSIQVSFISPITVGLLPYMRFSMTIACVHVYDFCTGNSKSNINAQLSDKFSPLLTILTSLTELHSEVDTMK